VTGRARPPKLVLAVIDGLKPSALEKAVADGRAPVLQTLMERGTYVDDCCAAFPSVTPCCAATIATGRRQDEHRIASMNWYHREEKRYVEYGSSFGAARRIGIAKQLGDLIYRMNHEHLPADVPTVFERLDDAGVRTAGTTYLFYRGRHEHKPSRESPMSRLATTVIRKPVMGPKELFYADLFSSQETGCWSRLGMPGLRDQHTGCVGAYLVEHDLFDFLLFSLPDNDTHSHEHGPDAQVASIAEADRQLERLVHAGGGIDAFLEEHAVIVVADHSHALVEKRIDFFEGFAEYAVLPANGARPRRAEIALCPAQRSAMVYGLVPEARAALVPRLVETARGIDGVDVVMWRASDGTAAVARGAGNGGEPPAGELRFAPGDGVRDARGESWILDGDLDVLELEVRDGVVGSAAYPDALSRIWAALSCETSGDVLLSAAAGREFPDWGDSDHVDAGSHGSLHADDSLGALVFCGVEPPAGRGATPGGAGTWSGWSIADVTPMALRHFGLDP
jgi:hypothetical protein